MKSRRLLVLSSVAFVLVSACSGSAPGHAAGTGGNGQGTGGSSGGAGGPGGPGGMAGAVGDGRFFVPDGLPNTPHEGEVGVTLKLVGSTLMQGPSGSELYAAVRNDGTAPSCGPGIVTDFFDKAGQNVATAATALRSKQLYRMDGNVIIGCIDPGQIGMSAQTNLPAEVVLAELGSLKHRFPTFGVDGIVPVAGLTVSQVEVVAKGAASAYAYIGRLTNGLDVTVSAPSVTIFPVNRVGRPLGAATSSGTTDIPPGGSWSFETSTVDDPGVDQVAYPAGSIPN